MLRTLIACAGLSVLSCASAQTPTPAVSQPPGATLSDKLNKSGGVIKPNEVDPAMDKSTPTTGDRNVVPPKTAPSAPATPK